MNADKIFELERLKLQYRQQLELEREKLEVEKEIRISEIDA